MRRFFSVWLILLVIVAFAAALLVSYPLLTAQAEQAAADDLNVLLDAAFTRIALAESTAKTVSDSAGKNILGKARAVDRFLAHDDALLQTDALVVLCEMLNFSSVDVTDMDGNIVASSVAGRIGRSLTEDKKTAWTREVLEGEDVSLTIVDEDNAALLSGCVSRTDTEGLICIQSLDVAIMEAMTAATPAQVLLDMSFIKDTLAVADEAGNAEGLSDADAFIVTRAQDGVTLAAARPLAQVYTARSAVLLAEAIGFLLCMLFAAVIQSMLIKKRLESRKGAPASVAVTAEAAEADAPETAETTSDVAAADVPEPLSVAETDGEALPDGEAPQARRTRRRSKAHKPHRKIFEFVEVSEEDETPEEAEPQEEVGTPEEAGTAVTGTDADDAVPAAEAVAALAETLAEPLPEESDVAEEAAAEFAAPEAVLEEPLEEETPPKRRAGRRKTAERTEAPDTEDTAAPAQRARRKRRPDAPADADSAFDKIFD